MTQSHVLISGTGRAGTTFIMHLLTELGLDTGFSEPQKHISSNCNAGLEWENILSETTPYIIKNPRLCTSLSHLIDEQGLKLDYVYVPIRDLFSVAQSRRDVETRSDSKIYPSGIPGGLWKTKKPADQEMILAYEFHVLIHTLVTREIPFSFIGFPRLVEDPKYLYRLLSFLVQNIPFETFYKTFRAIANPSLIHDFRQISPNSLAIR